MGTEVQAKNTISRAPLISPYQSISNQQKNAFVDNLGFGVKQERTSLALPKNQNASSPITSMISEVVRSPGRSLDSSTRSYMEPRLGHDFSLVKVHVDPHANESARAINASAYTIGNDIVLPNEKESVTGSYLLAHELAHVVQQSKRGASGSSLQDVSSNSDIELEANNAAYAIMAGRSYSPTLKTGLAVHKQGGPPPPPSLGGLTATRVAFNNAGAPDANNCAVNLPPALGVDGPAQGENGMEMVFRINGAIPPGTEFDITRTVADGLWQQDGGAWTRLGGLPAGTNDDRHDQDECLSPVGGRIFVIDTPGVGGSLRLAGVAIPGAGNVSATATAAVWKLSFAEWVIARNRGLGIGWQSISAPTFHRWHSILSVASVGGVWSRVDTPSGQHNEIALGSITTTGPTP